jgi:hypothetical protein
MQRRVMTTDMYDSREAFMAPSSSSSSLVNIRVVPVALVGESVRCEGNVNCPFLIRGFLKYTFE